jgi:SAM-dependent methyltransferase
MTTTYWRSAAHDEAMQDEHGFIWEAMLATIDVDLAGRRVLDAGCNRGGFLRLLADRCAIAEGFGYDPAAAAVEDARRLAGDRPLRYEAADTVPAEWHAANAEQLELPPLYEIDDVIAAFQSAGFEAAASRLAMRVVPAKGHGHADRGTLLDWLAYYYDQKLMLRFSRVP